MAQEIFTYETTASSANLTTLLTSMRSWASGHKENLQKQQKKNPLGRDQRDQSRGVGSGYLGGTGSKSGNDTDSRLSIINDGNHDSYNDSDRDRDQLMDDASLLGK